MRLWEQPATADQHFVQPCLVSIIDLWANVGALNARVMFAFSMRRSEERARRGVHHFMRPGFIPFMDLCANFRALGYGHIF